MDCPVPRPVGVGAEPGTPTFSLTLRLPQSEDGALGEALPPGLGWQQQQRAAPWARPGLAAAAPPGDCTILSQGQRPHVGTGRVASGQLSEAVTSQQTGRRPSGLETSSPSFLLLPYPPVFSTGLGGAPGPTP